MMFEMKNDGYRIEGCSISSISQGLSLTRIAFGRALSSYLTFLQGTIMALQQTNDAKRMNILELHHKMYEMSVVLERLSHFCRCHLEQDITDKSIGRFGFYLPFGADLLSLIYKEILEQSVTADPLWIALLLSLLEQASKPYRDMLSRWLGTTPSVHSEQDDYEQSQFLRQMRNPGHQGSWQLNEGDKANTSHHAEERDRARSRLSVFDCHLQQSLQGLDPFGEFFVRSRHAWSWDGSEPIILADPLDFNVEFFMSDDVLPPIFMHDALVERVLEAGKELQILAEYEPEHPLIAHNRQLKQSNSGFEWLYAQGDIAKTSSNNVLRALAMRLEARGWLRRPKNKKTSEQKGKQRALSLVNDLYTPSKGGFSPMELDIRPPGSQNTRGGQLNEMGLHLEFNPDLQGFFSLSHTLGQTKDMSLTCPDMMEFLLEPLEEPTSSMPSPLSLWTPDYASHTTTAAGFSEPTGARKQGLSFSVKSTRLENMAPLTTLANCVFGKSISIRTSLINTCVLSLYFHDLNLLGHFDTLGRFMLMQDGVFVARMAQALFDEDTGLLARSVLAATAVEPKIPDEDRAPVGSVTVLPKASTSTSKSELRTSLKSTWPPRSGELEMTLRAVLLDCIQTQTAEVRNLGDEDKYDSEVSDMDICDDDKTYSPQRQQQQQTLSFRNKLKKQDISRIKRSLDTQELEESLAFAIKEYNDVKKIPRNVNALEALDFLYLDYKAPRPLRLLFLTPETFDKYTRLFTFRLRFARIDATLKRIYQQLRTRQKDIQLSGYNNKGTHSSNSTYDHNDYNHIEMKMLYRYRFEAQQIFDGIHGYISDVAIGATWKTFMTQLENVQERIEDRIMRSVDIGNVDGSSSMVEDGDGDGDGDGFSLDPAWDKETAAVQFTLLDNMAALHDCHDHFLNLVLQKSFLKRIQAPILKLVHGILSMVLKFSQHVDCLPPVALVLDGEANQDLNLDRQREQLARITNLKKMHSKLRSLCTMLVKILKTLDERGLDIEGNRGAPEPGKKNTHVDGNYLQQLLMRLDMFGFHENGHHE
ncbi:hypothetical protein BX616_003244 [Lobosporangium transversale]|nr:hypothetical protein BX616_003244 [Lobosporangium transversale]